MTSRCFLFLAFLLLCALPVQSATPSPGGPVITAVRIAYQSPQSHSAYPTTAERIVLRVLIWVKGQRLPYSSQTLANDTHNPLWLVGTQGFGIRGSDMVYTELGLYGDGRDNSGQCYPERLPESGSPSPQYLSDLATADPASLKSYMGFGAVRAWPANWPSVTLRWSTITASVDKQKSVDGQVGDDRWIQFHTQPLPALDDAWMSQDLPLLPGQERRGTHRYSVTATCAGGTLSSLAPFHELPRLVSALDASLPPEAFATRISVRDTDSTSVPFVQYATMFAGVPYSFGGDSWGGHHGWDGCLSNTFGMDCSGLVTLAYRFAVHQGKLGVYRPPAGAERTDVVFMKGPNPVLRTKKLARWQDVQPGDMMLKPGHVRIVLARDPVLPQFTAVEAAGSLNQVALHVRPLDDPRYTPYRIVYPQSSP